MKPVATSLGFRFSKKVGGMSTFDASILGGTVAFVDGKPDFGLLQTMEQKGLVGHEPAGKAYGVLLLVGLAVMQRYKQLARLEDRKLAGWIES